MHDHRTKQLERTTKDDGGRDSIAVVVAVDRDALFPLDRSEDPIDRRRHVRQLERIVQVIERRMQKPLCDLRRVNPANREQSSDGRANPQLVHEDFCGVIVAGEALPEIGTSRIFSMPQRKDAETQRMDQESLNQLSRVILTLAIKVHSKLGPGLLESVYEPA